MIYLLYAVCFLLIDSFLALRAVHLSCPADRERQVSLFLFRSKKPIDAISSLSRLFDYIVLTFRR